MALDIVTLMWLSGLICALCVTGSALDKAGGNYWGLALLNSQGHFFLFTD